METYFNTISGAALAVALVVLFDVSVFTALAAGIAAIVVNVALDVRGGA